MTLSTSTLAYTDCFAAMDAALADAKGIAIRLGTRSAADMFRMRCHYARALDRKANAETYDKGHPRHGVSEYDRLILRIREGEAGEWWVRIEENLITPTAVVSLSSGEPVQLTLDLPQALPPPPLALAPPPDLGEAFDAVEPEPTPEPPAPAPRIRRL